jgi:hypothetical protein
MLLLLCGGVALACSSYSPISNNLQAEVAQEAQEAQEVLPRGPHESHWPSLMTEVGVLVEERRGMEIWCLRCSRPSAR